jgi:hypothetical protein
MSNHSGAFLVERIAAPLKHGGDARYTVFPQVLPQTWCSAIANERGAAKGVSQQFLTE